MLLGPSGHIGSLAGLTSSFLCIVTNKKIFNSSLLQIQIYLKRQRHVKIHRSCVWLNMSVPKYCVSRTGKIILNQTSPVMVREVSQILLIL